MNQDDRILEYDFHAFGVGHEVGRKVAAIELHAFHNVQRCLEGFGLFHRNDAVLANFLHRVGDDCADFLIAVC